MEEFDISQFTQKFIEDANELINELENNLLELEKNVEQQELVESVFRALHTLKGVGSMYGFEQVSEYTHQLESLYEAIRENKLKFYDDIFTISFRSVDHLRNLLKQEFLDDSKFQLFHKHISEELSQLLVKYSITPIKLFREHSEFEKGNSIESSWQIVLNIGDSLLFRGIKLLNIFKELSKLGNFYIEKSDTIRNNSETIKTEYWEIILISNCSKSEIDDIFFFLADDTKIVKLFEGNLFEKKEVAYTNVNKNSLLNLVENINSEIIENESVEENFEIKSTQNEAELKHSISEKKISISVNSEKLDKLMFIVSEMVTLKSEMQNANDKQDLELLSTKIDKYDKLIKQLRNVTISARLVSISELTLKFKRLVRDLSQQLHKKVELITDGREIEVDKNIIDLLADPLMHLIRNCLDHGIELPDERKRKGKQETGIIKITSYQSGNNIFIKISDDGKGIDKNFILRKAIDLKFINENTNLTEKDVFNLIFLPGFSTAEHLTQISGRGVGMDVVKKRLAEIRGEIEINTEVGKGTTFTIKIQQSLSILDTLLIQTGKSYYTIPMEEVEICTQTFHSKLEELQNSQIQLNNDIVPFCYLRRIFKIDGEPPVKEKLVVINTHNKRFAIVTDSIVGQYQAVVKPVGILFQHKEFIAGASIMGDGNIAVMLDTNNLESLLNN